MARTIEQGARKARGKAESGTGWYAWLARTGLVAKGISYGLVGVLALGVATQKGGEATSRQGALHALAGGQFGQVALALLAAGFAAYALWRFVEAVVEREDEGAKGEAEKWGKRAGYVGLGLIYAALSFSTVKILLGSGGGESQTAKAHHTTATVLSWPAGRLIVGAAGLCFVGAGLWNAYCGLTRKFEEKWRAGEMSETERRLGGRVGVVGHLARGVVFGLIGIFLLKAAIEHDPKEAIGLDGALHKLAQASYGPWLLGLTAAGLIAYGVFCLFDARYRDISAN